MAPVDWLVCESTYGNRRHDPADQAEEELAAVVRDTVARGGRVIVPSFAVGRTQEIVYLLHVLHDAGRIRPCPCSWTARWRCRPPRSSSLILTATTPRRRPTSSTAARARSRIDRLHYLSKKDQSKRLNAFDEPCIVISSSGMCEAGRILHHLATGIGDARNTILIVGFQGAGTLGRAIADRHPTVRIFGERFPLRAQVKILNAFSAHADYVEIGNWVARLDLDRLKGIFLMHGEPDAQARLAEHPSV